MIVISQILDWKPGPSLYESSFQVWLAQRGHCEPNQLDGWIYIYICIYICIYMYI